MLTSHHKFIFPPAASCRGRGRNGFSISCLDHKATRSTLLVSQETASRPCFKIKSRHMSKITEPVPEQPPRDELVFWIRFAEPSPWNQFHLQCLLGQSTDGNQPFLPCTQIFSSKQTAPDRIQRSSHHVGSADSQQVKVSFKFLVSSTQEITGKAKILRGILAKGEGNQ